MDHAELSKRGSAEDDTKSSDDEFHRMDSPNTTLDINAFNITKEEIEDIIESVKNSVDLETLTLADGLEIFGSLMAAFGQYKNLSGTSKRNLVSFSINEIIRVIPDSNIHKTRIVAFFGDDVGSIIDFVHRVYLKMFDINGDGKVSCAECKTTWEKLCCCVRFK